MSKCRHIGSYTLMYDTPKEGQSVELKSFGQLVELPDEVIERTHSLVTEEEFASLDINPDHLVKFASTTTHANAPADFIEKRDRAWAMMTEKKARLGKATDGSVQLT